MRSILIFLILSITLPNFILCDRCDDDILKIISQSKWNTTEDGPFLQSFIRKIYGGNVKKTEKVLQVINQFNAIEPKAFGYRFLFDEIKHSMDGNSSEMMAVIFNARLHFMNNTNNEHIQYILNNLPDHMRNFPFFNEKISIKNIGYPMYLFADDDNNPNRMIDEERGIVAVSNNGNSSKSEWELHPNRYGTRFRLFNKLLKKYLYADVHRLDPTRRYSLIWKGKGDPLWPGSADWLIEPLNGQSTFRIKNVYWDEYLYTYETTRSPDMRLVLLWRLYGCSGTRACEWQFENVINSSEEFNNSHS